MNKWTIGKRYRGSVLQVASLTVFVLGILTGIAAQDQTTDPVEKIEDQEIEVDWSEVGLKEAFDKLNNRIDVEIELREDARKKIDQKQVRLGWEADRISVRQLLDALLNMASFQRTVDGSKIIVKTRRKTPSGATDEEGTKPRVADPDMTEEQINTVQSGLEKDMTLLVMKMVGKKRAKMMKKLKLPTIGGMVARRLDVGWCYTEEVKNMVDEQPLRLREQKVRVACVLGLLKDYGLHFSFRHGTMFITTEEQKETFFQEARSPQKIREKMNEVHRTRNRELKKLLDSSASVDQDTDLPISRWLAGVSAVGMHTDKMGVFMGPGLHEKLQSEEMKISVKGQGESWHNMFKKTLAPVGLVHFVRNGLVYVDTPESRTNLRRLTLSEPERDKMKRVVSLVEESSFAKARKVIEKMSSEEVCTALDSYRKQRKKVAEFAGKSDYSALCDTLRSLHETVQPFSGTDRETLLGSLHRKLKNREELRGFLREKIEQLGNRDYSRRKEAMETLRAAGPVAVPELKKKKDADNSEVKTRVRKLLEEIRSGW